MSSFPKQTNVTFTREPNALNPNRTTIKTIQNGTRTIYELKLERMSDEDTGNYFCEVRNALKTQRQFVETLSVQGKILSMQGCGKLLITTNYFWIFLSLVPKVVTYNQEVLHS